MMEEAIDVRSAAAGAAFGNVSRLVSSMLPTVHFRLLESDLCGLASHFLNCHPISEKLASQLTF